MHNFNFEDIFDMFNDDFMKDVNSF